MNPSALAFSKDGNALAIVESSGAVRVADLRTTPYKAVEAGHGDGGNVYGTLIQPDTQRFAVLHQDHLEFWSRDGKNNNRLPLRLQRPGGMAFTANPNEILLEAGGAVYPYSLLTNSVTGDPLHVANQGTVIAGNGKGRLIAGLRDTLVRVYDNANTLQLDFRELAGPVSSVALSADGVWAAAAATDTERGAQVALWRVDWQGALQAACERLRNHELFKHPSPQLGIADDLVKQAIDACRLAPE